MISGDPHRFVITGFGHDRPGIVAGLTQVLMQHGCNLEDSRMTILAGEFAVIVIAQGPASLSVDTLQQALAQLEHTLGFATTVKPLTTQASHIPEGGLYLMRVSGQDKTGITYHSAKLLADHQLDILDLQAQRITGDNGPVYLLLIEFILPPRADITEGDLRHALTHMSQTLGVESHLTPVDTGVL
jgi:glycine cleavage system transcriptional repressor